MTDKTADEPDCIIERRDANGYYWRFQDSPGEPLATSVAAVRVAATVAQDEARKSGKTYLVAMTTEPAVYALPFDHPEFSPVAMTVLYELTPEGECIRRKNTHH
jgi:hypothetical protein